MLSADAWLSFVQARHDLAMSDISYDARSGTGRFSVWSPGDLPGATFLLPRMNARRSLSTVTAEYDSERAAHSRLTKAVRVLDDGEYLAIVLDLPARTTTRIAFSYR